MRTTTPSGIIKDDHKVKVKKIGNRYEVLSIELANKKPTVKRIDRDKLIKVSTGEVIPIKHTTERGENQRGLRESQQDLYDLLSVNALSPSKMILLTLTFANKQTDITRVNGYFKDFIWEVRREWKDFGRMEYIAVPELYANGGYHLHMVLFYPNTTRGVFLELDKVCEIWRKGNIDLSHPKSRYEMSHYLTAHKSNEITDKNAHLHEKAELQEKLPTGRRLYWASRGVKRPEIFIGTLQEAKILLDGEGAEFKGEVIYAKAGFKGHRGNTLYNAKQDYVIPPKPKRQI